MQEDCLIIRIPKFTGYKTLAFNVLAATFGLAALTTGVIEPVACYVCMGMGSINVLLRLVTSTPVWSRRSVPGSGGTGNELPEPEYRPMLPAIVRRQSRQPVSDWHAKYARQTVAPTVPRPVCVSAALAACVAAEPASLPVWGEEKFPEFLYRATGQVQTPYDAGTRYEAEQNAPLPSETLRGRLHGFLAFALVGALALFPLAACGALSELGTAIAGQPLARGRE